MQEVQTQLRKKIRLLAKQIRSKEVVASILEDGLEYYDDLIESKAGNKKETKPASNEHNTQIADPKLMKDYELLKKRNENLLKIMLEFENQNKQLKKGLEEIQQQIVGLNTTRGKGSKGRENIIKCPTLEKLLIVNFKIQFKIKNVLNT